MGQQIKLLVMTLIALVLLDGAVAGALIMAKKAGVAGSLVSYFEYGRSVPGKHDVWRENPGILGNLYDVAWRGDIISDSAARFAVEPATSAYQVRSYGMSFSDNILKAATVASPDLVVDIHSGPGAPPNFTYAVAMADAENRRAGDIVILAILSSSLDGMGSMSNRTSAFEQPAPFTYPIYYPDGAGLTVITPLIESAAQDRQMAGDLVLARAWQAQLAQEDRLYTAQAFRATVLDYSPFMRLIRRALVTRTITARKLTLIDPDDPDAYPVADVLTAMITTFADQVRQDRQIPVIFLIQSRDPVDPNLLRIVGDALRDNAIPYLATQDHFDPTNPTGFRVDGHYTAEVDALFGQAFLDGLPVWTKAEGF